MNTLNKKTASVLLLTLYILAIVCWFTQPERLVAPLILLHVLIGLLTCFMSSIFPSPEPDDFGLIEVEDNALDDLVVTIAHVIRTVLFSPLILAFFSFKKSKNLSPAWMTNA